MHVAFACHNFPPEFRGGTERVVLALALALQTRGHRVVVVAGSDEPWAGHDISIEDGEGVEVLRVRRRPDEGYGLVVRNLRVRDLVTGELQRRGCDLLHVHHWSTLSVHLGRAARAKGMGAVATLHDLWTSCGRFFRRPPPGIICPPAADREACAPCAAMDLDVPLEGLARGFRHRDLQIQRELRSYGAITVPSAACARAARAHVPWAGPLIVLPHGLLEPVLRSERAPPPVVGKPLRVGTFGNLVRDKGVRKLVEALTGLDGVELHLHGPFLGKGFESEVRELAAARGVALHCHGSWGRGDPHPASTLHLAVFPSLCQETYGLVVDEALARGVPVVVSNLGALRERVGRAGVVCEPTPEALREVIERLREPRALAALRAAIPAGYTTIEDAAGRYEELYADAVARVRGA